METAIPAVGFSFTKGQREESTLFPGSQDPLFTRSLTAVWPLADPTRRSQAALPAAAAPLLLELALSSLARLAPSVPPSAPRAG